MARVLSFRSRLVAIIFPAIVIFGAAVFAMVFVAARKAVSSLSHQLIVRQIESLEQQLDGFFDPARNGLRFGEAWTEEGLLDPDRTEELRAVFLPILRRVPQISSVLVADDRGHEFMLLRTEGRWISRQTRPDEWPGRVKWIEWTDRDPGPRESWKEIDYDPRQRPWYRGAMARRDAGGPNQRMHWTAPYKFFTTKRPGITAAVAFPKGGRTIVLGFDILLEDISGFTMKLGLLDESTVFVLTGDGLVVGLPPQVADLPQERRAEALLRPPAELGLAILTDSMEHLPLGEDRAARFRSDGDNFWGGRRRYELGPDRDLEITVVVPEARMLGEVSGLRTWIAGLTVVVLLGALWRTIVLARRVSRPVEALVAESDRMSRGDLEPGLPVETRVVELHQLAGAHDRMRVSLKKLLALEGEIRIARQIQQDTFPEQLPRVKGFDCAGLTLPAAETGGDSYDAVGIAADGALTDKEAARAFFLVADATGHGLGPALSVTQVRAMVRMAVRTGRGLAEIVQHLNEQLCDDLDTGRFVTAWFGELDVADGTLTSVSAGQGPLLRYEAAGGRWIESNADMPPLGIMAGLPVRVPPPIALRPGDLFVVLSDGFYEAAAPDGELFGTERVRQLIEAHRTEPVAGILDTLLAAVETHLAGAPAADDRTALLIKRA